MSSQTLPGCVTNLYDFLIFKVLLLWMLFIMAFGTTFFLIVDKVSILYYKSIKKSNVEHLDNSKGHTAKFGHLF